MESHGSHITLRQAAVQRPVSILNPVESRSLGGWRKPAAVCMASGRLQVVLRV